MFKCVHLGECVYREWTTTRCRMHFCPRLKKLDCPGFKETKYCDTGGTPTVHQAF